jgi:hypothetical protein
VPEVGHLIGVDLGLGRSPVVIGPPVVDELLQVGAVDAVVPVLVARVVREARQRQALLEVGQHLLGDVDRRRRQRERPGLGTVGWKGLLAHHHLLQLACVAQAWALCWYRQATTSNRMPPSSQYGSSTNRLKRSSA